MSDKYSMTLVSTDNISSYIQSVRNFDTLTKEEEKQCAEKVAFDGNLEEGAKPLIMSHLKFVVHIARSYLSYGLPLSDLIQEGNLGLIDAVKRYHPDVKARLVSFSVHWIKKEIHKYILRNWRIVEIASTEQQRNIFFELEESKKRLGWDSDDEINMVAESLGVSLHEVREMESRMSARDLSYDLPANCDMSSAFAPVLFLADRTSDIATNIEKEDWQNHISTHVAKAMMRLDRFNQHIIRARWLDEDKISLEDLANMYHTSIELMKFKEQAALEQFRLAIPNIDI